MIPMKMNNRDTFVDVAETTATTQPSLTNLAMRSLMLIPPTPANQIPSSPTLLLTHFMQCCTIIYL
jgi:hypothetical protein